MGLWEQVMPKESSSLSAVQQALRNGRENPVLEVDFVQRLTVPQKTCS